MPECNKCNAEWQKRYILAAKRFDSAMNKAILVSLVSAVIALICIIITIFYGVRTQNFISTFEYVEETEIEIEQNEGINTAVIGNENEVSIDGTENNCKDQEVLAEEVCE